MDLTLTNDDSLPLFIENITDAYNLSSDAFVSSPYANLSRQPTPFFRAPIVESMCVDLFEVPSLDALMTEFRETVLDSNQRPLRPSFPSVYTESSMFAARAAAPCMSPIIQDEYGSGSGTAGEDGCPGGGDTTALFVRIQDALSPTSTRMSSDKLMESLRNAPWRCPVTNRDFSFFFQYCSDDDLGAIVDNMKVFETAHLMSGHVKHMDDIPTLKASVTHCFLVLGGSGGDGGFADSASDRATVFGADAARTPVKPGQVKKVKISAGHVLGFDALNNDICTGYGNAVWAMSLNCCELEVTLCSIPLSVLRAAVGSFGRATADTLRCFLQSAFVWRDIVANRMEKGQVENDARRNTDDESERFRTATCSAQASVSGCARVKVYSPGARVFAQGSPRHYVHIVLQGHCSLVRTVKSTSSQVIEIDAHKHDHSGAAATLLPGDFIVLDGEGSECLEHLESSADLAHSLSVWGRAIAGSAAATSTSTIAAAFTRSTARQLLRHCFGRHRHSLVCRTRVEVCSIPMHVLFLMPAPAVLEKSRLSQELRDSLNVLRKLAALSDRRCSYLHIRDEALLERHCEEERWAGEKRTIIRQQIASHLPNTTTTTTTTGENHLPLSLSPIKYHSPRDIARRSQKFSSPRLKKLK